MLSYWINVAIPAKIDQTSLKIKKIPCYFPVNKEFWAETGSSMTASTTNIFNAIADIQNLATIY